MSQPPGTPPEQWKQRKDGSTALAQNVMDLRVEVGTIRSDVHGIWPKLVAILGSASVVIVGAVWVFVTRADARNADDVRQIRVDTASQVMQVRTETQERLNRFEGKLDAVVGVTVKGESRAAVKRELEQMEKEK